MMEGDNLSHSIHGVQFKGYAEWCQQQAQAPRGRVFVAMMTLRFNVDRSIGNTVYTTHLLNVELQSLKNSDIREFVGRVRSLLNRIDNSKIQSPDMKEMLFNWLYGKFKTWREIKTKIDEIKEAPRDSKKRTFNHLWQVINNHLIHDNEDRNEAQLAAELTGKKPGTNPAAAAKAKAGKSSVGTSVPGQDESAAAAASPKKKARSRSRKRSRSEPPPAKLSLIHI